MEPEHVDQYQCTGCGVTSSSLEEISDHIQSCTTQDGMEAESPGTPEEIQEVQGGDSAEPQRQPTGKELWTDAASRLLLELYEERQHQFGNPKIKKRTIWKEISALLMASGYPFTPTQTENRWKTMTAAFRRVKDNNNRHRSGRQRKTCPYERELEELLGDRPNVQPVCLAASLPMPTNSENTEESSAAEAADGDESPSTSSAAPSPSGHPAKKRCRETREDRVLAWLEAADKRHEASKEKWRKKKLDALTDVLLQCHKEKMEKLEQLLSRKNGGD